MAQITPYLNFPNTCREAMNFYQHCFGGDLEFQVVGEIPEMAAMMPVEMKDSILHSSLTNGNFTIMASDMNRFERAEGNTVYLCIHCNSEEELNSFFSRVSEGGTIIQPIAPMPWGALYGEITDKYEKHWMFNFQQL